MHRQEFEMLVQKENCLDIIVVDLVKNQVQIFGNDDLVLIPESLSKYLLKKNKDVLLHLLSL